MDKVIIKETIDAPVELIWKALTDKVEMKKWFFDLDEFKPEVGFKFRFEGEGGDGITYLHLCEVTKVVEYEKLEYSWTYESLEGYSVVSITLIRLEEGAKTLLTLIHTGLDTFPKNNPNFAGENFYAGWTEIITKLLVKYLSENS